MTKVLHFKCLWCGRVYSIDEAGTEDQGEGYIALTCPDCGNDEYEEVEQCVDCGEWFDPADLYGPSGECRCEDCLERAADIETALEYGEENPMEINGFFEQFFSPVQIEEILYEKVAQLYTDEVQKVEAISFCKNDIYDFADWLERREAQI